MKYFTRTLFLLAPSLFAFAAHASSVTCSGTEPYWSVTANATQIVYNNPNNTPNQVTLAVVSKKDATGVAPDFAFQTKSAYTSLTVLPGDCTDDAGNSHKSNGLFIDNQGTTFYGCCDVTQ